MHLTLEKLQNIVYNNILVIYINKFRTKGVPTRHEPFASAGAVGRFDNMKIIGLTGPSGAGKGMLSSFWADRGLPVIDADRVYHELLVPPSACLDELVCQFGSDILAKDGTLDRTALAALVFADGKAASARRETLNRITHRYVTDKVRELLASYKARGDAAAVIDAPLLIESGLDAECDVVVAVISDRQTRLERLIRRDGKDREALLSRIDAQPGDGFYTARADTVVINDGDEASLRAHADAIIKELGLDV